MQYGEALQVIGGLSRASKMPWYSWSLSATACHMGSKLRPIEGSTCHSCYAMRGNYRFSNVVDAQARRMQAWQKSNFVDAFVLVLHTLWGKSRARRADGSKESRFRWFDSGDLQSVDMLRKINSIAEQTPQLEHWMPTRELGIIRQFLMEGGEFAANLRVRVSVPMVGDTLGTRPFGLTFSTTGRDEDPELWQCPARKRQGNQCLECEACWGSQPVNYPIH